jgi:hypothetical protein
VLIELEVVDGPLPDALEGVIVNVYAVTGVRPVNVKVVSDVVCVVVGGEDTIEYWDAYRVEFHTRLTAVVVGLEAVKPVTAGGGGRRVLIELEVVGEPLVDTLKGVIVNVYAVSGVRPVNVKDVPGIVCVVVGGEDTMEYWDAYRTWFHARLTVEVVGLEAVKPTTDASCGGNIDGDTLLKVLDRVVVIVVAPETGIAKNVPSPKATEPQLLN